MASKCLSWRGHRYEARYDEVPMPIDFNNVDVDGITPWDLRDLMIHRVYVHDICVRCGDVVTRERAVQEARES
jgi:hypothetical protein